MILFVIVVLTFWTVVNFTDYVFKSCLLYPYLSMLERGGMSLKLLRAQFYFTRFNRVIHQIGRKKPRFLHWWFTVGAVVSIVSIVPAVWILVKTALGMIRTAATGKEETQVLELSLPGVNLPLSDILYYIATLIVCSIFHELGHALAAVRENVRVQGCGLFVLGIFPGAFVDLPKEQVSVLSPWRQLKIYCAGVWHNIVAALLAMLLLFGSGFFLTPFYAENSGVSVISVLKESGAYGPGGLLPGDHIIAVDNCDVRSMDSWKACLGRAVLRPQHGYCQKKTVVESEGTWSPKDCCRGQSNNSLCFTYVEAGAKKQVCLPARHTLQASVAYCNSSCSRDEYCLKPVLQNGTKLVEVKRANWQTMLFLGPPAELWYSVSVIKWVPRQRYLSVLPVHICEVFLRYVMSFSGALALLNVVPCIALDGQWITQGLIKFLAQPLPWLRPSRKPLYLFVVLGGSLLLALNVVLGFWRLLAQTWP
ncbi:membrane-bound transcription factor site-2 protease [Haemaphysalis longicornis]